LIDDDARVFELLSSYLRQNGVDLEHARDGAQGLRLLGEGGHDAVLLDGMMPGMDGLEVLRRIRERSAIPVLMLTARGDEADRVVGLELGDDADARCFSVEDRGPGFAEGEPERVFASFVQGRARAGGSLGLGLSLVERIAKAHGGRVWARNRNVEGACVGLSVSVGRRSATPADNP
jgi:CheY-like chemotaxis protein